MAIPLEHWLKGDPDESFFATKWFIQEKKVNKIDCSYTLPSPQSFEKMPVGTPVLVTGLNGSPGGYGIRIEDGVVMLENGNKYYDAGVKRYVVLPSGTKITLAVS